MYAPNLRHGVQYGREQKRAYGISLHGRELSAKDIARLSGVGVSTVYRWAKELREQEKQERDGEIQRLRDGGLTQQEIADELGMGRSTVAEIVGDSQKRKSDEQLESEAEPAITVNEDETGQEPDQQLAEAQEAQAKSESGQPSVETGPEKLPADEQPVALEPGPEPDADEALVDEDATAPAAQPEPAAPQEIPD